MKSTLSHAIFATSPIEVHPSQAGVMSFEENALQLVPVTDELCASASGLQPHYASEYAC